MKTVGTYSVGKKPDESVVLGYYKQGNGFFKINVGSRITAVETSVVLHTPLSV